MSLPTTAFKTPLDATRAAMEHAPAGVGYAPNEGWIVYSLADGCPERAIPELFVSRLREIVPLTDNGINTYVSMMLALADEHEHDNQLDWVDIQPLAAP